jgi:hypothetical protein
MRKPIVPRLAGVAAVYVAVFFALSVVQFAKQDGFTRKIGSLVVTGKYGAGEIPAHPGEERKDVEILVGNAASVFFGGLEFFIGGDEGKASGGSFIDFDEIRRPFVPVSMNISAQSVRFRMTNNVELAFYVHNEGAGDELVISSGFSEDAVSVELPYRLTKSARITDVENADIVVMLDKKEYTFDRRILDTERGLIVFSHQNPVLAYREVPQETVFNPVEFIISGAMDKARYREMVLQWCEKAYRDWNGRVAGSRDEALLTAYVAEAARRGSYGLGASRLSEGFVANGRPTFLSSPYIGRLESAISSVNAFERQRTGAIEEGVKTDLATMLDGNKNFDYLLQRSLSNLFEEGIASVKTLAPDSIAPAVYPGIFQGWWAFDFWYKNAENPFEILANQARLLMSESLKKDAGNLHVFFVQDGEVDVLFNIKLGMAVAAYGEAGTNNEWAAVGRSLILSALSFADESGGLCLTLGINEDGAFAERVSPRRLEAAEIYPLLEASDYYPHTVGAGTVMFGVYLWTASPAIGASYKNNVLEFDVAFPENNAHYLLIRGIRPFKKIQMRGMDYRSDPQFERYNSPGWVYRAQDQTLLIKLFHRTEVEAIKIFY